MHRHRHRPKDYYDTSGGDNRCPDGNELAPSSLTFASITATPTQYGTPIGTDQSADPMCMDAISRRQAGPWVRGSLHATVPVDQ